MISRNQIRQTVVQYLYGVGMSRTGDVNEAGVEDFWQIVFEPSVAAYNKAKSRVVEHLTRDYADKARVFQARAADAMERLHSDVKADPIRESLREIVIREDALQHALVNLRVARKNDPDCETGAVEKAFDGLKVLNDTLLQFRTRLFHMLQDMPEQARQTTALAKAMERMQEIGLRIDALDNPETTLNKAEFANVIELREDMETLRSEAGSLINAIVGRRDELDKLINSVVEHFSSDRISPIERAIIRIAAYELKYKPELPTPVIASEAIRLAEKFSITEAPRFINGILAGIARECRTDELSSAE